MRPLAKVVFVSTFSLGVVVYHADQARAQLALLPLLEEGTAAELATGALEEGGVVAEEEGAIAPYQAQPRPYLPKRFYPSYIPEESYEYQPEYRPRVYYYAPRYSYPMTFNLPYSPPHIYAEAPYGYAQTYPARHCWETGSQVFWNGYGYIVRHYLQCSNY